MSLITWQWSDYADFHQDRRNLAIHVVAVPLFMLGNIMLLAGWLLAWWLPLVGIGLSAGAMAAQGKGHAREANPPKPFTGPLNVVSRIVVEQWVTWPRYVLSGRWRQGQE